MRQIEITGKLIDDCLIELLLTDTFKKLEEIKKNVEKIEEINNRPIGHGSYDALRCLG